MAELVTTGDRTCNLDNKVGALLTYLTSILATIYQCKNKTQIKFQGFIFVDMSAEINTQRDNVMAREKQNIYSNQKVI